MPSGDWFYLQTVVQNVNRRVHILYADIHKI